MMLKGSYVGETFSLRDSIRFLKIFGNPTTAFAPSGFELHSHDGSGTRTSYWLWISDAGDLRIDSSEPSSDASGTKVGEGVAGANTALSNLATVRVNAVLTPATDGSADLGTDALSWGSLWLNTAIKFSKSTNDLLISATDQGSAESTVNIPSMTSTPQDVILTAQTQTLAAKTLTSPIIVTTDGIADDGGAFYLKFVESGTPVNFVQITSGDAGSPGAVKIEATGSDTNIDLLLDAKGSGDVAFQNGTELRFDRATYDALVVVADQAGEHHTFNIPNIVTGASDTFVFLAEAQTLTNKTLTAPVISTITNTGTVTLFTDSDTVVGRDTTDTLTTKTITSAANTLSIALADLGNSGGAAGDVAYWDGSNWVRLAKGSASQYLEAGTTPSWSLPSLASAGSIQTGATIEDAGANDAAYTHTQQGTAGATVVIPNFAAALAAVMTFDNFASTFSTAKKFNHGMLTLGDNDNAQKVTVTIDENLTGDKTLKFKINDGSHTLDFGGNVTFAGAMSFAGAWTHTGAHTVGITTQNNEVFDFAGATGGTKTFPDGNETLVGRATTDTLSNKTLTAPKILTTDGIADSGGAFYLKFVESGTPVDYLQITSADAGGHPLLEATGNTANVNLELDAKGTGAIWIKDNCDLVFMKAAQKATVVVADQTGEDHTFNIPDIATGASDTFAFLAEAQTLTNKSIDQDNNTITNLDPSCLEDTALATDDHLIPFIIPIVNGGAADIDVYAGVVPFKMRVIDAWAVNTKAGNGGSWKLTDGGADVTTTVAYGAGDDDITRAPEIDDAAHTLVDPDDLHLISSNGADTAIVYVLAVRET